MADTAAFFDLDRTLLRGASAPVITAALKEAGVLPDRTLPGEGLFYRAFDIIGETLPGMALARRAATFAAGWSSEAVIEAATEAAKVLSGKVQPFARQLMDAHRAAGRKVVLATTSPFDMVKPFADELGLDDVIATRYGLDEEGRYDGSIVGNFVWGPGKLSAVRSWAAEHDVEVGESWAYSDSVYDYPLLAAVRYPHAVNPDPRLRAVAILRRWPTLHLDVPPGVPKLAGIEPYQVLMQFLRPEGFPYARFDIAGTERIPREGPAIVVANHRSYFDSAAVSVTVARAGRPLRFLGKKEVFDAPVVGPVARAMGGIRVERGTGSDEPLDAAALALQAGELVAMMPQGTIPRGRAFFEPVLKGRWGAARLAARTGAPIVPVGMWGTEKVWPRSARLPNVLNLTRPPKVRIRVGEPFHVEGGDLDEDTVAIMAAIADLLPAEAREQRQPTQADLVASFPPGYKGDPEAESDRRPGRD
ncbi:MAG: HAD-IB family hydrolase [Actinomycetota bacterium]|nr:HAD-IB family hydrolase [Actinomycetota bacterium]